MQRFAGGVSLDLGAGRIRKEDEIDYLARYYLRKKDRR